jgi:coenzyme F420-dependent glucose-6-phosphate dehydrogenase
MISEPSPAPQVEKAGFDSIWLPDHFAPFSHGFAMMDPIAGIAATALPILPQILSSTAKCQVGTNILCPTLRYHPAIIAQYFAQLDMQFPGRVILGVGTGEAVNATPFLGRFPAYRERRDRLREAIDLMRKLWTSQDYFNYDGQYYPMKDVFLYTKPKETVPIVISAFGEKSATLAGEVGDGIILMWQRPEQDRNRILQRFNDAVTKAGKDPDAMIKIACFMGGVTSATTAAVQMSKATWSWSKLSTIHDPDPKSIDAKGQQMPDEEALQYCTFVPKGEDLIEHFDTALKTGINHVIMYDMTPAFVAYNMSPPEAANWPIKVLPPLRDKYK